MFLARSNAENNSPDLCCLSGDAGPGRAGPGQTRPCGGPSAAERAPSAASLCSPPPHGRHGASSAFVWRMARSDVAPGEIWTLFAHRCWQDLNRRPPGPSKGAAQTSSKWGNCCWFQAGSSCTSRKVLVRSGLSDRRTRVCLAEAPAHRCSSLAAAQTLPLAGIIDEVPVPHRLS